VENNRIKELGGRRREGKETASAFRGVVRGRTAPGGSQEGRQKWGDRPSGKNGVVTDKGRHQASHDFWERQNCSPPRARLENGSEKSLGF